MGLALLLALAGCGRLPDAQSPDALDEAAYVEQILKNRQARDEEFRSAEWSPLAVIAIARLDRLPATIGSETGADLRLPPDGVSPGHAEVVGAENLDGGPAFRLRPLEGTVTRADGSPLPPGGSPMPAGERFGVGRFLVYADNLGTFGAVVRALDFTSPSYTRFQGLDYFPPDLSWRVEAVVVPYRRIEPVTITDTNGWQRPAWRYGEAHFSLEEKARRLVLITFNPDPRPGDAFFIAFTDATRGAETYPAGRYLQPAFTPSGPMILDFNEAFNPSCAYNHGFACPLPPPENRLRVPVRAGEKTYAHAGLP